MKKTVLSILLTFFILNVFAGKGNTVKLLSGSIDVLKENATAVLEMDYSETTWEKDEVYELWCGNDFEERVNLSTKAFEKRFNITSKGLKIKTEENAKYKIVFKVIDLEQHQSMSMWGRLTMEVTGKIDIINIATGENVLSLQLTTIQGEADFAMGDRIIKAFSNVAERLFGKIK